MLMLVSAGSKLAAVLSAAGPRAEGLKSGLIQSSIFSFSDMKFVELRSCKRRTAHVDCPPVAVYTRLLEAL